MSDVGLSRTVAPGHLLRSVAGMARRGAFLERRTFRRYSNPPIGPRARHCAGPFFLPVMYGSSETLVAPGETLPRRVGRPGGAGSSAASFDQVPQNLEHHKDGDLSQRDLLVEPGFLTSSGLGSLYAGRRRAVSISGQVGLAGPAIGPPVAVASMFSEGWQNG